MKIVIDEEVADSGEMVNLLEQIKVLIIHGNTSGFYPHWRLEGGSDDDNSDE